MALDKELVIRDGELHSFYHQYNSLKVLDHVVVAYYNERAIACGALKKYHENSVEIKRMFVLESERGKGIASTILSELESWAKELKYERCILETGINQPEAINLYKKIITRQFQIMANTKIFTTAFVLKNSLTLFKPKLYCYPSI